MEHADAAHLLTATFWCRKSRNLRVETTREKESRASSLQRSFPSRSPFARGVSHIRYETADVGNCDSSFDERISVKLNEKNTLLITNNLQIISDSSTPHACSCWSLSAPRLACYEFMDDGKRNTYLFATKLNLICFVKRGRQTMSLLERVQK